MRYILCLFVCLIALLILSSFSATLTKVKPVKETEEMYGPPLPTRLERATFICDKARSVEDRAEENLYILEEVLRERSTRARQTTP